MNLVHIIKHLEICYAQNHMDSILTALIAASWCYFIEGGFLLNDKNYDDAFCLNKWKKYVDLAQD